MIRFLRQDLNEDSIRVIDDLGKVYDIGNKSNSIYFRADYYQRYDIYEDRDKLDQGLIIRLNKIVRIEKKMDSEYFPVWTKEEGLINQTENFVKLNGRYYTIKFLEQLLIKIHEIKK